MHIQRVRCFGTDSSTGNEALVVFESPISKWSIADRQRFAAHQKANACVFVDMEDGTGPCALDFYYPHSRSPLCLHASLAAAHYLQTHSIRGYQGIALTSINRQLLTFTHVESEVYTSVKPFPVQTPIPTIATLAGLLGCAESAIKRPPAVASVGSPKLLVEMLGVGELYALRPELNRIVEWAKASAVAGVYAYVHCELNRYEGRNFNHLEEQLEDAATGVAAGALSVHLAKSINLYQGAMLGNSCEISASRHDGLIVIGGRVHEA